MYNGHVYKSLADHDPHSTQEIREDGNMYIIAPPWHVSPNTADALHVCSSYPWAARALVFADGSVHWTALAPQIKNANPPFMPGGQACVDGGLMQQGGRYGIAAAGNTRRDVVGLGARDTPADSFLGIFADVLVRREV